MDLPPDVIKTIDGLLGAAGSPYSIFKNGEWVQTNCWRWPLPQLPEDELNLHEKINRLTEQALQIYAEDPNDARIEQLKGQITELLKPFKATIMYGVPVYSVEDLLRNDPRKGIHPAWWKAREALKEQRVCVFLGRSFSTETLLPDQEQLIAMPSGDPFDFLRLHETYANNEGIPTAQVIERLKELDDLYGIIILNASYDSVVFIFKRKLKKKEAILLRKQLLEFCPSAEGTEDLLAGKITLWWD